MKYDPEIESWMKSFYQSLSPTEQRRYAAVEALKLDAEEEGVQYIVELLGCDPLEVDRARQEFVDGEVDRAPASAADVEPDMDFAAGLGGAAAGTGAAASAEDAEADAEFDPVSVAVSTETDEDAESAGTQMANDDFFGSATEEDEEAQAAAAAFWQEDGTATGEEDAFAMAPAEGDGAQSFGGFSEDTSDEDSEAASAVLEAAGTTSGKKRGKKKGPGPITNVLGIIVFGVVGIVAGYAILVFVAPDKAKQLFDWENAYSQGIAYFSAESASEPADESKPTGPNTDFVPGASLPDDEHDLENYEKDRPNRQRPNNGKSGNNKPANGDGDTAVEDPFAIVPPDSGELTDPGTDEPSEDDPFGIDIPEIDDPGLSESGIDDPLALPESAAPLIRPATADRFETAQIDEAIDEVVALSEDPEVKFSRVYLKLCVVGDRLAKPTKEAELAAADRIESLESFLQSVATSRPKLVTVGKFSHDWLFSGQRKPEDTGVLLAGTVTAVENVQGGHKATVLLLDPEKRNMSVTIASDKVAEYGKGDRVIMLGTIIVDPATELENYDGDESPIVYPSVTAKL